MVWGEPGVELESVPVAMVGRRVRLRSSRMTGDPAPPPIVTRKLNAVVDDEVGTDW